jgi:(E)-4-hydroxy-3-methyl-but-2-enyl pyrophosphate reductase/cytidylate kinase
MKRIIIAIDGPAASGKSSTARRLAQRLGYIYLDTGAMYRACALEARKKAIALEDIPAISAMMDTLDITIAQSPHGNILMLHGKDITDAIRSEEVSNLASAISAIPIVREKMVSLQRKLGRDKAVVLDGRDIGTVVFPQAELKIFMIADVEERAKRRYRELQDKGVIASYDKVLKELQERDFNDSNRSIAPLKPAADSISIDTSHMGLEEQVELLYKLALQRIRSVAPLMLAQHSGFCFGVRRAIKLALDAAMQSPDKPVYTLGEIIHNPQFVKELEEQNIHVAKNASEIIDSIVIIRSHGIAKNEEQLLIEGGNTIIDATCPYVKRTHELVQEMCEQGYPVVILGDSHHPELIGMVSYGNQETTVVAAGEEPNIIGKQKLAVISQTTQKLENLQALVDKLLPECKELRIFNTICIATSKRQDATETLAETSDLMIVIGGHNSSNTKMLHSICSKHTSCMHIETEAELDQNMISTATQIGITAGASTPDEMIIRVYNKIKQIKGESDLATSIRDIPTFKEESC